MIFSYLEEPADILASQVVDPIFIELGQEFLVKWFLDNLKDIRLVTFRCRETCPDPLTTNDSPTRTKARPTLEYLTRYEEFQLPSPITVSSDINFVHGVRYDHDSVWYKEKVNAYSLMKAFSRTQEIRISVYNAKKDWEFPLTRLPPPRRSENLHRVVWEWEWRHMVPCLAEIDADGKPLRDDDGYRKYKGILVEGRKTVGWYHHRCGRGRWNWTWRTIS